MRITDAQAFDSMRRQVTKAREQAMKAQDQAATGLRVTKPSDDPVAAANARREQSRKALADGGVKNADVATTRLVATDQALDDVFLGLTDARTLAVEGSTAGVGEENRRSLAVQVRKIREQMVNAGNTTDGNKYVFAGYRDDIAPFQQDGTFVGDDGTQEVQTLPNVKFKTSINGQDVFGPPGDDLFKHLDDLATALETGDTDGIREGLTTIDTSQKRVLDARGRVGAMANSIDTARVIAARYSSNSVEQIATLTEADQFEAATDLIKARTALDAAITVAQQIPVAGLVGSR